MKTDLSILFCSCDRYKDLWAPFFTIFKDQWPDCEYDIYLNTESETFNFTGLNIHCLHLFDKGDSPSYGKRMIEHLKRINSKYVLLLLDDFFIREKVDGSRIKELISYMDEHDNVDTIRITPYLNKESYKECTPSQDIEDYYIVPRCYYYKLSFQAGLWRRDSLLKYWREEDDPWRWEVFANITAFNENIFLVAGYKKSPIIDYGFKVGGQPLSDVYRGKWVRDNKVDELFADHAIDFNFEERGYYSADSEIKHFNSPGTIKYVVKRIGIEKTVILANYILKNWVRKKLHLKFNPLNEYYKAFKEQ